MEGWRFRFSLWKLTSLKPRRFLLTLKSLLNFFFHSNHEWDKKVVSVGLCGMELGLAVTVQLICRRVPLIFQLSGRCWIKRWYGKVSGSDELLRYVNYRIDVDLNIHDAELIQDMHGHRCDRLHAIALKVAQSRKSTQCISIGVIELC